MNGVTAGLHGNYNVYIVIHRVCLTTQVQHGYVVPPPPRPAIEKVEACQYVDVYVHVHVYVDVLAIP